MVQTLIFDLLFVHAPMATEKMINVRRYPIALEERTTFYGMREIGVYEPGGLMVVFAARGVKKPA